MPELPEVETTRLGVTPHVIDRPLASFAVRNPNLRWPVELPATLIGETVAQVRRRAKYLLFDFPSGTLILHLGMSGSLRIVKATDTPKKHDHIDLVFGPKLAQQRAGRSPGAATLMRYNDPRRFGSLHFQAGAADQHWLLKHLGPEPFAPEFTGAYLKNIARKRKQAVKNFIMDGRVVVGVGNIYANEALFLAGIRPTVPAAKVTLKAYDVLASAIVEVLQAAIHMGGTTLRDFVGSNGEPGYFKQQLYVYGRAGLPCRRCHSVLKPKVIGQRASVYCPKCQRGQGFTAN